MEKDEHVAVLGSTFDMESRIALLNAYFSGQPVCAKVRKWDYIAPHVDDHGKLQPFSRTTIQIELTEPKWANHPAVAAARQAAKGKSGDEVMIDGLISEMKTAMRSPHPVALDVWRAYHSHSKLLKPQNESIYFKCFVEGDGVTLSTLGRKAMARMEAEGTALSREALGLGPKPHTVVLEFPTAQEAMSFLAKWKADIGKRLDGALARLKARTA